MCFQLLAPWAIAETNGECVKPLGEKKKFNMMYLRKDLCRFAHKMPLLIKMKIITAILKSFNMTKM